MHLTISHDTTSPRNLSSGAPRAAGKSHEPAAMFSRARHFALALVPFTLAVGATFVRDYFSRSTGVTTYVEPLKAMLAVDASAWFHVFVFSLFVFGTGAAVVLIDLVNRLEASERSGQRETR